MEGGDTQLVGDNAEVNNFVPHALERGLQRRPVRIPYPAPAVTVHLLRRLDVEQLVSGAQDGYDRHRMHHHLHRTSTPV